MADDWAKLGRAIKAMADLGHEVTLVRKNGVYTMSVGAVFHFSASLPEVIMRHATEVLKPLADARREEMAAKAGAAPAPTGLHPANCAKCGQITTFEDANEHRLAKRVCMACFKAILTQ